MRNPLRLSTDDLAFFRLTCDLFPTAESPLQFLEGGDHQPENVEATFVSLESRGYLNDEGTGAARAVLDRVLPVSECNARVALTEHGGSVREFFLNSDGGVEYLRDGNEHRFGSVRSETALAAELAQQFTVSATESPRCLRMNAGDYLVFAVFARDVRASPEPPAGGEAPMSVDEVLAYFDEPETKLVRTPSDDTWQASIAALAEQGVLLAGEAGYELEPAWHPLAREIVADSQRTVVRFDFLDDQWLVREVSLYPTAESVYRLGTEPDGTVVIEELSVDTLADTIANVIGTLPNLLGGDASLRDPMLTAHSTGTKV